MQREDDKPDTIKKRLDVFETQTMPLIDYYDASGRLARIDATQAVGAVTHELIARSRSGARPLNMVTLKSAREIETMRRSGKVTAKVLTDLMQIAKAGMTTRELDQIAERGIRELGGIPTFMGYHGYPATICSSVNDEVVHGIPSDYVLQEGDLLSIDIGTTLDGYVSDSRGDDSDRHYLQGRTTTARRHATVSDAGDRADAARQSPRRH